MKGVTGKEVIRLAELHGWKLARVTGSHHIFSKPGSIVRLSVPVHGNRTLKIGTLKQLLKLAEISEDEL